MSTSSDTYSSGDDEESLGRNYYKEQSGGAKNGAGTAPLRGESISGGSDEAVWYNPFSWGWSGGFWFWVLILGIAAVAIVGLVLAAIAFDDDDIDEFDISFKVLRRDVEHDADGIEMARDGSGKVTTSLNQGLSIVRKGTKLLATTTNIGVGITKSHTGEVLVVNTGVVDIVLGGGLGATKIPLTPNMAARDSDEDGNEYEDERVVNALPTGYKVLLTNMGVNSLKAATHQVISKRDVEGRDISERTVSYISEGPGITVFGDDNMTLSLINTGVVNISTDGSLTISGNSSFPILGVTGYSPILTISIGVSHTDLAAGGTAYIQPAVTGTARYILTSISSRGGGSTAFSGGGGDRNIVVGAVSRNWYSMSAANLGLVNTITYIPANSVNGFIPDPANAPNSPSSAGDRFFVKYSGGTTDYTAGSIEINIVLTQTVQ